MAHLPDGSKETLLSVPRYDFNWQITILKNLAFCRQVPRWCTVRGGTTRHAILPTQMRPATFHGANSLGMKCSSARCAIVWLMPTWMKVWSAAVGSDRIERVSC